MSSSCDGVSSGRFSECTRVRVMYGRGNTTFQGAVEGGGGQFQSRRIRAACKHLRRVAHFVELYQQEGYCGRLFEPSIT